MARTLVITRTEDAARVPFLRGILTRSLQVAGVPFDTAHALATEVRDELKDVAEISAPELRAFVGKRLDAIDAEAKARYLERRIGPPRIIVADEFEEEAWPFSRGRLRDQMARCGLTPTEATHVAEAVHAHLGRRGIRRIEQLELAHITYDHLREHLGPEPAQRFLVWEEFKRSGRPLLILLGGMAGTGKSTVAAGLAGRFDIVRTQSTDMLREVMRVMTPPRLNPVLHTSSFLAWEKFAGAERHAEGDEAALIEGYLSQAELLDLACEAVLGRAIQEHVSLILEGVHIHPGIRARLPKQSDTIVVEIMLGVLRPKELKQRLRGRGKENPGRRARRYLEHFDEIWTLQSFLLAEADRLQVPIVANVELERTLQEATEVVMAELARQFTGKPKAVFG